MVGEVDLVDLVEERSEDGGLHQRRIQVGEGKAEEGLVESLLELASEDPVKGVVESQVDIHLEEIHLEGNHVDLVESLGEVGPL